MAPNVRRHRKISKEGFQARRVCLSSYSPQRLSCCPRSFVAVDIGSGFWTNSANILGRVHIHLFIVNRGGGGCSSSSSSEVYFESRESFDTWYVIYVHDIRQRVNGIRL